MAATPLPYPPPKEVGVEIYAWPRPRQDAWLNADGGAPRALDPAPKAYLTTVVPWTLYNGKWSLFAYTLPVFQTSSPRYMAYVAFGAGSCMTLLATALLGVTLRARDRQERLTEQIREARDALLAAEKEREKLSHDLHDHTVQTLYAIQLGLGHTSQQLAADPAGAKRELATVRRELDAVMAEIRRYIAAEEDGAKPADLSGVLTSLVQRAQVGAQARLEVRCDPGAAERLAGNQAVQLANIAREALSNSLRHARPSKVQVALRSEPTAVCLEIRDNGLGFDPRAPARQGVGLNSMAARARQIGSLLDIRSVPGQGTRVTVCVAAPAAEPFTARPPVDDAEEP
ncbi:MAG: hypothetical protein FJ387_27875 [Verrucomicrobia bacterium]|nr:hypothetical protein [Verrucomicrobiota bacterium]